MPIFPTRTATGLLLSSLLVAGAPLLRAETPQHPTAQTEPHHPEAKPEATPAGEHGHAAPAAEGAAAEGAPTEAHGQAAHGEATEAHGGGHHGPVVKLGSHVLSGTEQFLIKLFNFAIFAGGLFFLLKGVLGAAFKARTKEVEEQLARAEREKAEGEAQMRELEARMKALQAELDEVLTRAQADAEQEKLRILEAAKTEADAIVAQARQDIASQQRLAEMELRALVADLAVKAAEARLAERMKGPEAQAALDRAIHHVGGAQ